MKLCMIQKRIDDTDITAWLDRAADESPDIVALAELATTGCLYQPRTVPTLEQTLSWLEPYPFAILVGLPFRDAAGLHNAYVYYYQGKYQLYTKINLFEPFDEPRVYRAGTRLGLFETDHDRLGVAICYDLRFDDIFARLKEAGASKVFVPAAFPAERTDDYVRLLSERAVEHRYYVFGINAVGRDERHQYGGRSRAVAPDGTVLASADETAETVITVSI